MKKLSPIIFGTSCLGNLYKAIPMETKVAIAAEWFKAFERPVIDSAGKYGAGLSLECIGKALKALGKKNGDLTISVKLDYRKADSEKDAAAFAFRERYLDLCRRYGLDPAAPAVEYAYRLGFDAVALNTASPHRILKNAAYANAKAPEAFWRERGI